MKVLFLALCLVTAALAQPHEEFEGPICPVEDPSFNEGPVFLSAVALPVIEVGGAMQNVSKEGFSTKSWKLILDADGWDIIGTVISSLGRATGNATYSAFGFLDARPLRQETLPSGNFTGAGRATFSVTNVQFQGNSTLLLDFDFERVQLKTLHIDSFQFDSFSFDLGEGFVINGETPNWAELSANFKANFEQDFAKDREGVTELLRQTFNAFTHYSIDDLYALLLGEIEC